MTGTFLVLFSAHRLCVCLDEDKISVYTTVVFLFRDTMHTHLINIHAHRVSMSIFNTVPTYFEINEVTS